MEMTFLDTLSRGPGTSAWRSTPSNQGEGADRHRPGARALLRALPRPVLRHGPDPYFRLGGLFRIRQAPTTFLVDGSGTIVLLREGFEQVTAVELTRNVERALKQEAGFFSFALRSLGVNEQGETALLARLVAAMRSATARAESADGRRPRPGAGIRRSPRPQLALGVAGRRLAGARGLLLGRPVDPRRRGDGLSREDLPLGHDAGLDILAVATGRRDAAHVQELMDRYRKYHSPPSYRIVADPDGRLARCSGGRTNTPDVSGRRGRRGRVRNRRFFRKPGGGPGGEDREPAASAGKTLPALGTTRRAPRSCRPR